MAVSAAAATLVVAAVALCPPVPTHESSDGTVLVETERGWAFIRSASARAANPLDAESGGAPAPPARRAGLEQSASASGGGAGLPGVPVDPSDVGAWSPPRAWPVIAIHAALLPTGEVLHYSYPTGAPQSQARTWNPVTDQFTNVNWGADLFCSGQTHLADGTLYVTGGNAYACQFQGRAETNLFDPVAHAWTALGDMADGRWYPSSVTLGDGRVLIFTGLDHGCATNPTVELFTPGAGLSLVPEGASSLPLYSSPYLLSDGRVAMCMPANNAYALTLGVGWEDIAISNFGWRYAGTSAPLPGGSDAILVIGGNSPLTNTCEIIDFSAAQPSFAFTGSLHHPRAHANAVLLPDRTVLVIGGGQDGSYGLPVLEPELYDPASGLWTLMASHVHARMYHSTTLLLPDGRVLVAGQDSGESAFAAEIYSPPYLFRGARPQIDVAPPSLLYGETFSISRDQAGDVASVVLIKLSSVTHSTNFGQRLLDVPFVVADDEETLSATAPAHGNVAPPGYYMLFIVSDAGVPSTARIVRVGTHARADLDLDGAVSFDDLTRVLTGWGPCPPLAACPPDLDGDGEVRFHDLVMLLVSWGS